MFIGLAQQIGVEIILGSFLAGAILSLLSQGNSSETHHRLEAFGFGFFIPIFFVLVGAGLDLGLLVENPQALLVVAMLLVAAYLLKLLPALLLRIRFSWRESLAGGFLMSSRLSLIIAAAAIGLRIGAISESINAAVVLVALISVTLSPVLFHRFMPELEEEKQRRYVTIVGANRAALLLAQRLDQHQEEVCVIDNDPSKVEGASGLRVPVILGDGTAPEGLDRARAHQARTLVAMTGNDEVNLSACRVAQECFGVPNVIALIRDPTNMERATQQGVQAVTPDLSTLMELDQLVRHPTSYRVLAGDDALSIEEIAVRNPTLVTCSKIPGTGSTSPSRAGKAGMSTEV